MTKTPVFALHLKDWSLPGAHRILQVIHNVEILQEAATFILDNLFNDEIPPPEVQSITIIVTTDDFLRSIGAAAFHSSSDLDPTRRTIEISETWLSSLSPERLAAELLGVLRHELVHCFQPEPPTQTPSGLVEGIADWVRLISGLRPPHWEARKTSWDAGYDTTAYFLAYLEEEYGRGTVAAINNKAFCVDYSPAIWKELLGKDVDMLWDEYCNSASN
ncbi:hypothetical protein AWENTII_007305 [Aspergillus wentii]|nr:hypothetical protein MW887_011470 [Aspergillus wentii]